MHSHIAQLHPANVVLLNLVLRCPKVVLVLNRIQFQIIQTFNLHLENMLAPMNLMSSTLASLRPPKLGYFTYDFSGSQSRLFFQLSDSSMKDCRIWCVDFTTGDFLLS